MCKFFYNSILCAVICIAFGPFGTSAAVAQDAIQLSVVTGAGGMVREHSMAPVFVQVQNQGPAVDAWVVAEMRRNNQPDGAVSVYRKMVLPERSVKRVVLYVEVATWAADCVVTVRQASSDDPRKGDLLAQFSETVKVIDQGAYVQGVVDGPIQGLLTAQNDDGQPYARQLYFSSDFLPELAEGWEMCDSLAIKPRAAPGISQSEAEALREWVALGGDLQVIASEPSPLYDTPAVAELTPYTPISQQQTTIESFGADVIHTTGQRRGGRVLFASSGIPLVIQRSYGLGTVTVFTFDIENEAFGRHRMRDGLWRRLAPEAFAEYKEPEFGDYANPYDSVSERITDAVTRTPELGLQLFAIVVLIGLYAAAVGPGDYILVRRMGRPLLTWITFPAMVLIFVSVAFLGASVWVGGDQETHAYRSIVVFSEDSLEVTNEAVGFFAAGTRFYRFERTDGALLRDVRTTYDNPDPTLHNQDEDIRIQRIPTWTARAYSATRVSATRAPVTVTVQTSSAGDPESVTVLNKSDSPITPLDMVVDGRIWPASQKWQETTVPPGTSERLPLRSSQEIDQATTIQNTAVLAIWRQEAATAPRYRSLDMRPLLRRNLAMFRYTTSDETANVAMELDGAPLALDSFTEVYTVILSEQTTSRGSAERNP